MDLPDTRLLEINYFIWHTPSHWRIPQNFDSYWFRGYHDVSGLNKMSTFEYIQPIEHGVSYDDVRC